MLHLSHENWMLVNLHSPRIAPTKSVSFSLLLLTSCDCNNLVEKYVFMSAMVSETQQITSKWFKFMLTHFGQCD